ARLGEYGPIQMPVRSRAAEAPAACLDRYLVEPDGARRSHGTITRKSAGVVTRCVITLSFQLASVREDERDETQRGQALFRRIAGGGYLIAGLAGRPHPARAAQRVRAVSFDRPVRGLTLLVTDVHVQEHVRVRPFDFRDRSFQR